MSNGKVISDRKSELAQIHIARDALRLSEDEYRDLLYALERVRSAADLSWRGRAHVLSHFRRLGWKGGGSGRSPDAVIRKIRSLWLTLRDRGALRDASERALRAYVHRTIGVERMEWCSPEQKMIVIESLKDWISRSEGAKSNG